MPSPFPGMDPYLEDPAYWLDFHSRFINCWCEAIADALPQEYEASLGERVYLVEHGPDARKLGHPNVAVKRQNGSLASSESGGAVVATLEPVTIPLTVLDGPRDTYVEILHQPNRSLVSVLELLSPAIKEEPGRTQYLAKRNALINQQVHLVELDLLRGGRRLPLEKPLPPGDCYYFLARAEERPNCQVYHWTIRDALPALPVPLRAPDADIVIELASVFTTAFDRGRFARRLRYDNSPPAHWTAAEKDWGREILKGQKQT